MAASLTPQQLKSLLADGAELALLDVREQGLYSRAHLFHAVSLPLSWLELQIDDLVPRRDTRIVLCDEGAGPALAPRARHKLESFGYSDVRLLAGGMRAWAEAGFEVFSGVNVPSKAFGEFVEVNYDTPRLSADELKTRLDTGEKLVILDSRPMDEFRRMSIPGGVDCPGAELVYRVFEMAPDPDTSVVVNCAGRTRSIIGAQSLRNAGIPNPVMALKDGTMGWKLAGLELAHGETTHAPSPSPAALAKAREAARRVAARFGVQRVDRATVERWRRDPARTLYLLDVRTGEEFLAGHLPGSRHAPGGQLVQATDEYLAVRNSRVVLLDDNGIRATMTASWLIQMGWPDVHVLAGGVIDEADLVSGPHHPRVLGFREAPVILPRELQKLLDPDELAIVVDLDTSLGYREAHVPGARWTTRARLPDLAGNLAGQLVLTSRDGVLAHLAARDILKARPDVLVLAGGTDAWKAAGIATESGIDRRLEADDVWYKPYDQQAGVEQAMRDYLAWEVNLVAQIRREGDVGFRRFD